MTVVDLEGTSPPIEWGATADQVAIDALADRWSEGSDTHLGPDAATLGEHTER